MVGMAASPTKPLVQVLLLLAISTAPADGGAILDECRPNWHQYLESCYGFGEDRFPWIGAQEICRSYGGKLVEIETEDENNFLKSQVVLGVDYWIGGNDIFHEGHWEWVTTSHPFFPFSDWISGQPAGGRGESCLVMDHDYDYQWQDFPCSRNLQFICESKAENCTV